MPFHDRYLDVGLRQNPFIARACVEEPPRAFIDRGIPNPPPPGSGTLVQVIGDSGLGKSAHLTHWRTLTPGPYHYIVRRPYRSRWRRPPIGPLVYGDEIDRMPSPLRRRWLHRLAGESATAVIGTHIDLRTEAERAGFTVMSHQLTVLDEPTLAVFLDQRLAASAIDDRHVRFSPAEVAEIFDASAGNPQRAEVAAHRVLANRVNRSLS